MKIWITTQYDTFFDFDEWAEEMAELEWITPTDPIEDFLEFKLDKAEEDGDYKTVVSIEDHYYNIYDKLKETIEKNGVKLQWV